MDTGIAADTESATHREDECIYNGNPYTIGMSFPASDGCNTCTCIAGSDGMWGTLQQSVRNTMRIRSDLAPCYGLSESECIAASTARWQQNDCLAYQFCEGATVCSCERSCLVADTVGTCVPASMEECNADLAANYCAEGYHCHDMGEMGDICLHDAEGLQCWSDVNCSPGQICEGAQLCGSLVDCLSAPGQCVPG